MSDAVTRYSKMSPFRKTERRSRADNGRRSRTDRDVCSALRNSEVVDPRYNRIAIRLRDGDSGSSTLIVGPNGRRTYRGTPPLSNGLPSSDLQYPAGAAILRNLAFVRHCYAYRRTHANTADWQMIVEQSRRVTHGRARNARHYSHSAANVNVRAVRRKVSRICTICRFLQLRGLSRNIALSLGNWSDLKLIIISQKLSVARYVVTSHFSTSRYFSDLMKKNIYFIEKQRGVYIPLTILLSRHKYPG